MFQAVPPPIPEAVCAVMCSWWWAEEPPETCRASVKINKFKKSCILLAVICNCLECRASVIQWRCAYPRRTETFNCIAATAYKLAYCCGIVRGQYIKKPNFFVFIYCFTYNLIKIVSFIVLPSTLDTPLPTFFAVLERVLRDGAKVPCRIFLSPLPSEIGDLLVRISTSGPRKSPQGPNLERRVALERSNSSWLTVTRFSLCICQQTRQKFCCNPTHLQFVGQNQVARTFTDSYFLGNFTGS